MVARRTRRCGFGLDGAEYEIYLSISNATGDVGVCDNDAVITRRFAAGWAVRWTYRCAHRAPWRKVSLRCPANSASG